MRNCLVFSCLILFAAPLSAQESIAELEEKVDAAYKSVDESKRVLEEAADSYQKTRDVQRRVVIELLTRIADLQLRAGDLAAATKTHKQILGFDPANVNSQAYFDATGAGEVGKRHRNEQLFQTFVDRLNSLDFTPLEQSIKKAASIDPTVSMDLQQRFDHLRVARDDAAREDFHDLHRFVAPKEEMFADRICRHYWSGGRVIFKFQSNGRIAHMNGPDKGRFWGDWRVADNALLITQNDGKGRPAATFSLRLIIATQKGLVAPRLETVEAVMGEQWFFPVD